MQTTPNDDEQVEYERWLAARGQKRLLPDSASDQEWLEEIEALRKSGIPLPAKLERLEREIYEEYGITPSDDA
jgi:hypothetical protein